MTLQNFCIECGQKIYPNQGRCPKCNAKTGYKKNNDEYFIDIPMHDVGFFNTQIDFSPIIKNYRDNYEYTICSCGYINHSSNEFCYNCGKKIRGKFLRFFKQSYKLPEPNTKLFCKTCGSENLIDSRFCESCGDQLIEDRKNIVLESDNNDLDNFKFEFNNSEFCFCGAENNHGDEFCGSCGRSLKKVEKSKDYRFYCSCGTLNNIKNDFCSSCGVKLADPHKHLICVCGTVNPANAELCSECNRFLSKDRYILSKLVCKCGAILDYGTQYCHYCGNRIGKDISKIRCFSKNVNRIKNMFE